MARKKLIGYDLDGTLADTRRDIIEGVRYMLRQMGKTPLSDKEIERCVGTGFKSLVSMTLRDADPKIVERGAKHLREYYEKHLLDFTRLYPGAEEVLEYFKDRVQIVITNKPDPFTTRILTEFGVMPYLKGVFTGSGGIPHKPDPAAMLQTMKKYDVRPEEVLWIGDGVVDIETGKNAGVETVILRHGFASSMNLEELGAGYYVDDFQELLKLAESKAW